MKRRLLLALLATVWGGTGGASGQCPGDCNLNEAVTVDELVTAINAALRGCDASGLRSCGPRGIVTDPDDPRSNPSAATALGNGVLRLNDIVYQASGFGNVSNMYAPSPQSIYPDVVELAGGPTPLAARAAELVTEGKLHRAMHLADVVLTVEADNAVARQAKRDAITQLLAASPNLNERGWLNAALIEMDAAP